MSDVLFQELSKVIDPELRRPITELGMVESAEINEGVAQVKILLTIAACPMKDKLGFDIDAALRKLNEVNDVVSVVTSAKVALLDSHLAAPRTLSNSKLYLISLS